MWVSFTKNVASGLGRLLVAMSLVASAAAGCGVDGARPNDLDGRLFFLESAVGFEPIAGITVRLSFDGDHVAFGAGCDTHGGAFQLHDGRLVVVDVVSNPLDIYCGEALYVQGDWLVAFMTSSPRFVLDTGRLTLTNDEATLVFLDRELADPDRPLAGTLWGVDSLVTPGSLSNVPLSRPPTVLFSEDGSLQVDTTCNTSGGHYAVSGDTLTLTDVAYTEAACRGASIETHLQTVLGNGRLTFNIDAGRLTLQHGDIGLWATDIGARVSAVASP